MYLGQSAMMLTMALILSNLILVIAHAPLWAITVPAIIWFCGYAFLIHQLRRMGRRRW